MPANIKFRKIRVDLCRGKKVTIPAWGVDSGKPGPCLLLTAAQHGNEVQGAETIRRFVDEARTKLVCGKVFAVPMVNIPAVHERRPHIRMKPQQPYVTKGERLATLWIPKGAARK